MGGVREGSLRRWHLVKTWRMKRNVSCRVEQSTVSPYRAQGRGERHCWLSTQSMQRPPKLLSLQSSRNWKKVSRAKRRVRMAWGILGGMGRGLAWSHSKEMGFHIMWKGDPLKSVKHKNSMIKFTLHPEGIFKSIAGLFELGVTIFTGVLVITNTSYFIIYTTRCINSFN